MKVRSEQMDALRVKAFDAYVEVLKDHVREHFPMQWKVAGEAAVERTIRALRDHARDVHGIDTRRGVMLYVTVAMLLGSGFDADPMVPWAARELAGGPRAEGGFVDVRMDVVADKALIFQKRVSGEGNRALYRTLILLNQWPAIMAAPASAGIAPGAEILQRLQEAHPLKAGYLGSEKLRALVTLSVRVAAGHGLTDFAGQALLALLHFMLGAHAHADPMLPWISEALDGTPGATVRLQARSAAFLADIVSKGGVSDV